MLRGYVLTFGGVLDAHLFRGLEEVVDVPVSYFPGDLRFLGGCAAVDLVCFPLAPGFLDFYVGCPGCLAFEGIPDALVPVVEVLLAVDKVCAELRRQGGDYGVQAVEEGWVVRGYRVRVSDFGSH